MPRRGVPKNVSGSGVGGSIVIGAPDANNSSYELPCPCFMAFAMSCISCKSLYDGMRFLGVLYSERVEMIVSHVQYDF